MKKVISLLIILVFAFATAVPAGMVEGLEPVERELILIDKKEEAPKNKKGKNGWIKWVVGSALIGGAACLALFCKKNGCSGNDCDDTATVTGSW